MIVCSVRFATFFAGLSHMCDIDAFDDSCAAPSRGRPASEAQVICPGLLAGNAAAVTFYPVLTGSFAQPRTLDVLALLALS